MRKCDRVSTSSFLLHLGSKLNFAPTSSAVDFDGTVVIWLAVVNEVVRVLYPSIRLTWRVRIQNVLLFVLHRADLLDCIGGINVL